MRPFIAPLVVLLTSTLLAAAPQAPPVATSAPAATPATALDRYIAAPDPHFAWKVLQPLPAEGVTATLLEVTSQKWLTEKDVERPLWTHWLTVVRSPQVTSDVGFLFITGSRLDRKPPAAPPGWMIDLARDTGTVVSELRLVPNQPIVFLDDPARKPRSEDDFIAYTWDKFLRTGDEKWPARLPMTKSAVRAMDAITAFAATAEGGGAKVARYVVAGGSKRGWTTWTTAAVDRRVVAIAPLVIDMLNIEPSFVHHWRAYGAWSDAVDDYVHHRIFEWMGTPQFRALMQIEEPFEYRDRLTLPKFIVNASGDEFFLPDSSQFYFDQLRGEKQLRYVPNTGHSMDKTDAIGSVHAFYASVVKGTARPEVRWTFEGDGSIKVVTKERPQDVKMWQATNPTARSFRIDQIGAAYTATTLQPAGPNTWIARVPPPAAGWTAFFVELTFPSGAKHPFKVTSGIRVLPETLPFPPPRPAATGLLDRVRTGINEVFADHVALRHDFHRHPEIAGGEARTARIVAERLRALGLDVRTGVGGHGVVGVLKGGRPGPLVAYRADMDAVRSTDPDPVEYRSLTPDVRHQCGHDVHMAVALALAAGLAGVREELPGAVMFVFQPAEETATGARAMLADNVFAKERPVAIYGLHTAPYEVGQLGTRSGVMMPARDRLRITISGEGDHAAAADAVRAALLTLSTIAPAAAAQNAPADFSYVQVGPARRELGETVMQASVTLAGDEARRRVQAMLPRVLAPIAAGGPSITHQYDPRWIAGVTNDAALTTGAVAALERAIGAASVREVAGIVPAFSEDFGSFQEEVPGVFFFLGVSNAAKGLVGMPHTPNYVADDEAIRAGARAMAAVVLDRLSR